MEYTLQINLVANIDDSISCDLWATVTVEYTPGAIKILDAEINGENYSKGALIGYLKLYHTDRLKAMAEERMMDGVVV